MPVKVALIASPTKAVEPLGVMFLAAELKAKGVNTDIFIGDDILVDNRISRYDAVGASVITGWHKQAYNILSSCEKETQTIIGGAHATFFDKQCIEHADIVMRGEAINSIYNVINQGTRNAIIGPVPLIPADNYPFADRESLYGNYPRLGNSLIKNVMASFGCPFACSYCYNDTYKSLYGPGYKTRIRPVQQVVDECQKVITDWNKTEFIFFQDDCFGFNIKWLYEFAKLYRKIKIPFHAQMRLETVNKERLSLLKLAGCTGITVAVEAGKQSTRKNLLNRGNLSNEEIIKRCNNIKEFGFKLRTEQMVGLPTTTILDDIETLKLNVHIKPDIAWSSIYAPYLGTKLGNLAKDKGLYNGNNDELSPSFFSDSCLNISDSHKQGIKILNRLFSVLSHIPLGGILAKEFILSDDINVDDIFDKVRKHIYDNVMYSLD